MLVRVHPGGAEVAAHFPLRVQGLAGNPKTWLGQTSPNLTDYHKKILEASFQVSLPAFTRVHRRPLNHPLYHTGTSAPKYWGMDVCDRTAWD